MTGSEQWVESSALQQLLLYYTNHQGIKQPQVADTSQDEKQQSHSLLEELAADRKALEHFYDCSEIEREGYLYLFRELLLLKERVPHLVARLPEKKSLNDLYFWQQLGWILSERKYLGRPLVGLAELPPEKRDRAALMSCETIIDRMAEQDLPFHIVMGRWSELFAKVRRSLQEEEQKHPVFLLASA